MPRTIVCQICGKTVEMHSGNQIFCRDCAQEGYRMNQAARPRKRRSAGKGAGPPAAAKRKRPDINDVHDLTGKSLARVDAEAKALGLSYGQYTAAVRSGSIDRVLAAKGITDPRKVLRQIKIK